MQRADLARWLGDYVAAWKEYDRDKIAALFADEARYRYRPEEDEIIGSQAIAESWFEDLDPPGSYEAAYEAFAIDGDRAVATGSTTYVDPDGSIKAIFDNCFVMRFDGDGRCSEFVEFFIERTE